VVEDYGPSFFDANSFSFVSFSSLEHFFQNAHFVSTAVVLVQKIRKFHNPILSQCLTLVKYFYFFSLPGAPAAPGAKFYFFFKIKFSLTWLAE
jgi:hypothetical protein